MKKTAFSLIAMTACVGLFPDFYLSDEFGKTIEAGEYVYINNTAGLDGFSVDFNKQLFADGGLVKEEGSRILLGRLRDDLGSGTADTVILNTINGMDYLELKISPVFSAIDFYGRESKKDTLLKGNVSFESRGKETLSGIDSVKILLNEGDKIIEAFKVFDAEESGSKSQSADFEINLPKQESEYSVSVVRFALAAAETTFYAAGFSNREREEYPKNLLIIDSRSRVATDNLSEAYYDHRFETVKTFYEKPETSMLNVEGGGIIVLIIVEGGKILGDLNFFSALREKSKTVPVFIFASGLCAFLANEENRTAKDYLEMLFQADFSSSELSSSADCEGILSLENTDAEIIDVGGGAFSSFLKKNDIYLFLYLPEEIEIDQLLAMKANATQVSLRKSMKSLSSVVDIGYDGYGDYSVEIYDISGKHLFTEIIGELPSTVKSLDMSDFLTGKNMNESGVYSYKLKKNGEEIQCGKFFFVYH